VQLKGYLPYPQLLEATRRTDVGIVSLRPTHPNNIHAAPNKLYYYIACKNIVLAQSLPGLSRIVENDALGFVCDFRDVDSIVRAMRQVLALSDLRERQDTAFVAHAQRYNWEAQQDELVELYSRLLS
jgi:glycosyltransferase involved in cell wall biosynthesis